MSGDAAAIIAALGGLLTATTGALVVLLREVRRLRAHRHHRERPSAPPVARRILLVDDDEDGVILFRQWMRPLGVEVVRAESAEAALEMMRREGFAAMVVDVRLPGMSGADLVTRLRPPVLLLSGLPKEELERTAGECGADAWVVKSGDPRELRETIARLLG